MSESQPTQTGSGKEIMTPKLETIETYNKSASALAKKFDALGARIEDINYVFSYCGKENPFVLEIGCGNGRDAQEISKRTNHYIGIDISSGLLAIAKNNFPDLHFQQADVEEYTFPKNIDIVFAFASLIHVPKESLRTIVEKLFSALEHNALLFISLKYADQYQEITKTDEFGTRTYWHYSQKDIEGIASQFNVEHVTIQDVQGQTWIDVLLRKK